jgi:hypothetical protein
LIVYDPIGPSLQFRPTYSFYDDEAEIIFLPLSHERKTLRNNPIKVLDINGVGRLLRICLSFPPGDCVTIGEMVKNVMLLNFGLMKIRLVSASNGINDLRDSETSSG